MKFKARLPFHMESQNFGDKEILYLMDADGNTLANWWGEKQDLKTLELYLNQYDSKERAFNKMTRDYKTLLKYSK